MNKYRNVRKMILTISVILMSSLSGWAQTTASTTANEVAANTTMIPADTLLRWILVGVIALFVLMIAVLANAIKLAGGAYQQKIRKEREGTSKILPLTILLATFSSSLFAQAADKPAGADSFSNWDVYLFITIILLLFIVLLTLVRTLFVLMGIKKEAQLDADGKPSKMRTWFQKLNETVPIEDEASLDMSHDYDGIRELDNKIPSWWTWTFLSSVLFAIIYMYRMFSSETLPDQYVELAQANEIAAIEKLAYLKKGANNVDENTVKMLGAAEITEGATLYAKNCVACHGDKGQGSVGPNLTDDYWIHKGGIKDIFYSIKYGWAEKGMKSWKEDFSPVQIAQLSSFIRTLHGTNPPAPKEKQGELYTEVGPAPADSTATAAADTSAAKK